MLSLLALTLVSTGTLIRGGTVVDGLGGLPYVADVRIEGDRIVAIAPRLSDRVGDRILLAKGLVVAPGFIDAHSHADGGIEKDPLAESQLTQGITTAVVGQDGAWSAPVADQIAHLNSVKPAIHFALFSGHGGIRRKVLGEEYKRAATPEEIVRMQALVEADMRAGALGLSSGLEYDPGYYSNTEELVALAKAASPFGGMYISHVRDEADKAFEAFDELRRISREGNLPAQISHIKLGSAAVWGKASRATALLGPRLTADVYPYVFWQSTAAALTPSREWEKREIWVKSFADVGGPQNVRLTNYTHEKTWVGKTLAEIAATTGRDAIAIVQEVLQKTHGEGGSGEESVAVTAMTEEDLETFVRHPRIMFSSDGQLGGTHPRGAGSFPRVLGRFVRERHVLSLQEAIRKMTSLPAQTFHLSDRGVVRVGAYADLVVFDPATIIDHATAADPTALSTGVRYVLVDGSLALANGKPTGVRAGGAVIRSSSLVLGP
ncbi:MAG: D-aminoacylase [Fimbriimonadaceae bacterium]|nr:D-aminoacylase [Chthonomonadaceae bacterium]MCO5296942.1 D-aminoacylase [Fimbriimonadaceae bacterium]